MGSTPTPGTTRKSSKPVSDDKQLLAYVIGLALGDGNLSNPNGRATRLRITCHTKYSKLIGKITRSLQVLLPDNKVSIVQRSKNCIDISCYSNHWEGILGWHVGMGSKIDQSVSVPAWIKEKDEYKVNCLRGLLETDGAIYVDRGYPMVMFSSAIPQLARDVYDMTLSLNFAPHFYKLRGIENARSTR